MSSTRKELLESAFLIVSKKIDLRRRYARELNRIRAIEQRLGLYGVADEVAARAKRYKEAGGQDLAEGSERPA